MTALSRTRIVQSVSGAGQFADCVRQANETFVRGRLSPKPVEELLQRRSVIAGNRRHRSRRLSSRCGVGLLGWTCQTASCGIAELVDIALGQKGCTVGDSGKQVLQPSLIRLGEVPQNIGMHCIPSARVSNADPDALVVVADMGIN